MNISEIVATVDPDSENRFSFSSVTYAEAFDMPFHDNFDIKPYGFYQVFFRQRFDFDQSVGESVTFFKGRILGIAVQKVRMATPEFVWKDKETYQFARKELHKILTKRFDIGEPRWTFEDVSDNFEEDGYYLNSFEQLIPEMEIINTKTGEPFEIPNGGWSIDWKLHSKKTGISIHDLLIKYQNQSEN
jgi:hypothetical protein